MAIKRTVHEVCRRCGKPQATLDPKKRVVSHDPGHGCPERVPGPPPFPVVHRLRDVIFEYANGAQCTECDGEIIPVRKATAG